MTVYLNTALNSAEQPVRVNALQIAMADAILALGSAVINIPGFDDNALVFCSRAAPGGGVGNLSCDRNPATGDITITSDDATETSTVYILLIAGAN